MQRGWQMTLEALRMTLSCRSSVGCAKHRGTCIHFRSNKDTQRAQLIAAMIALQIGHEAAALTSYTVMETDLGHITPLPSEPVASD